MDVASAKLIGAGLAAIGVGAAAAGVGYVFAILTSLYIGEAVNLH